jgi:Ca2+-binding EF-hand superfamily protein
MDVLGAFGSISANEFATRLAIDWDSIPKGLSDSELLELFDAICEVRGGEATLEYWIQCLAINTGDDRVSDLIFWPDQYFGVDHDGRELTSAEMLEVTLRNRTKDHI